MKGWDPDELRVYLDELLRTVAEREATPASREVREHRMMQEARHLPPEQRANVLRLAREMWDQSERKYR